MISDSHLFSVLSWDVTVETLMEFDDDPHSGSDLRVHSAIGKVSGCLFVNVSDVDSKISMTRFIGHQILKRFFSEYVHISIMNASSKNFQVSILLLSLQMIADGIEIDGFSLMKLNFQYLKITGFGEVSIIPAQNGHSFHISFGNITDIPGSALSCIEELVHVVDAAYFVDLPHMALGLSEEYEEKTSRVLIGTIFIDPCLSMISNLPDLMCLPVLTLKSLLETLYILVHKYDFEDNLLQHLQPSLRRSVLRTIELLSRDISYELRQLSLSIAQVSIKKWHSFFGTTLSYVLSYELHAEANILHSDILELVAAEIASQSPKNQDSLVLQCKLLIGNTLQSLVCLSIECISFLTSTDLPITDYYIIL